MIISISGNIASGKTTLASRICSQYNYAYVPTRRNELLLLNDFYDDVPRFFLSAQSGFLLSKAIEINELHSKKRNIVIDRSIYEDVFIFARYWMDKYKIDQREIEVYTQLANYVISTTPKSDVFIYCKCTPTESLKRLSERPHRIFESKYPNNFIQSLFEQYTSFQFPQDSLLLEIDSEQCDFHDDKTIALIMDMLNNTNKR